MTGEPTPVVRDAISLAFRVSRLRRGCDHSRARAARNRLCHEAAVEAQAGWYRNFAAPGLLDGDIRARGESQARFRRVLDVLLAGGRGAGCSRSGTSTCAD